MTIPSTVCAAALVTFLLQHAGAAGGRPAPSAFVPQHDRFASRPPSLSSSAAIVDDIPSDATLDTEDDGTDPESILQARNRLLALSTTLAENSPSGRFISRPADKIKLQKAINDLEALASSPGDRERELLLGDWTLIATASLPSSDIRRRIRSKKTESNGKKGGWLKNNKQKKRSGLSLFGSTGPSLGPLQKSIRGSIAVTQRVRDDGAASSENLQGANLSGSLIDRVDNVIEITPLDTLEGILPEESPLSKLLGGVNVNPLGVKGAKVVLVHRAEVESTTPVLRTKIAWTSSILNVAGTSRYLDPEGADVFGINNLLGEFGNSGTFDTPFVDDDIRVSRTSGPVLEQLRVFVRKGSSILDDAGMLESLAAEMRVEEEREVSSGAGEDDTVATQVKKAVKAADDVREAVSSMAENASSTIEKDMEGVSKALGDTMDDVAAKVQDAVEDDLEQIGKAFGSVQSAIQDGEDVGEALANVTKAVARVPEDVRSIVEEDATELGDRVEEALDAMVADVQDSVEGDLKDVGKSIEAAREVATAGSADDVEVEEEMKDE